MKDVVISVRMPASLTKELKILTEKNHYMDMSEHLRSVIRDKCIEYIEPYKHELTKIRENMEDKLATAHAMKDKKRLVEDLQKIIKELQNEK